MSLIERAECVEHGADRMIGGRCHVMVSPYVLCLRDGVIVEYVPASQLQGAVEAAREQIKALIMAQSAAGYVETAGWALLLDEIDKLPTPGSGAATSRENGDADR